MKVMMPHNKNVFGILRVDVLSEPICYGVMGSGEEEILSWGGGEGQFMCYLSMCNIKEDSLQALIYNQS